MGKARYVYVSDVAGVLLRMESKALVFSKQKGVVREDTATAFADQKAFDSFRTATVQDFGVKWPDGRLCVVYASDPEFATQDECKNVGLPSWG